MNYNREYDFKYDNDDDYRVCLLNAYNIVLENEGDLDKAISKLSFKQDLMYNILIDNLVFRNMLEEISEKTTNTMVKGFSMDFLFTYLHNYDFFNYLHVLICGLLEEDCDTIKLCELFKNKIISNI